MLKLEGLLDLFVLNNNVIVFAEPVGIPLMLKDPLLFAISISGDVPPANFAAYIFVVPPPPPLSPDYWMPPV